MSGKGSKDFVRIENEVTQTDNSPAKSKMKLAIMDERVDEITKVLLLKTEIPLSGFSAGIIYLHQVQLKHLFMFK